MREGERACALYFPSRFSLDSQSARSFDDRCVFVCTCVGMYAATSQQSVAHAIPEASGYRHSVPGPPELMAVLMREAHKQACRNAQRAAHTTTHALTPQSPRERVPCPTPL